ncbi:MAG: enoyl-CoA hydratase/isomerase family protein [Candidatus Nanopelagicales bacterium]|nr:enoyl-CoA hydratase/isomerase family protein [Candidatus Nanopelagicales bacterium]
MTDGATEKDGVRIERRGQVLHVTLASPASRNAQTPATWRRLAAAANFVTPEVRVVVLSGEGASFSAGLDRRMLTVEGVEGEESLFTLAGYGPKRVDGFIRGAQAAFSWWSETSVITIAAVQGHAIGAGFQLALACDVVIAADDALFAMREASLGLVPDLTGTSRLVNRIGYSRALEICASGRFVEADEAVRIGLAIAKTPLAQLAERTEALVASFMTAPAAAVLELKSLLRAAEVNSPADQHKAERVAQITRLAALRAAMAG